MWQDHPGQPDCCLCKKVFVCLCDRITLGNLTVAFVRGFCLFVWQDHPGQPDCCLCKTVLYVCVAGLLWATSWKGFLWRILTVAFIRRFCLFVWQDHLGQPAGRGLHERSWLAFVRGFCLFVWQDHPGQPAGRGLSEGSRHRQDVPREVPWWQLHGTTQKQITGNTWKGWNQNYLNQNDPLFVSAVICILSIKT